MSMRWNIPTELEALTSRIIRAAMDVHSALGPGLIEKVYVEALQYELKLAGLSYRHEASIEIPYKDILIGGQRLDLLVENAIVLELKSVDAVADIHLAQLLSYLRAGRFPVGLLINFNSLRLKDGLYRRVNERVLSSACDCSSPSPSVSSVLKTLP